jgi:glycopeptide antibiotics resistance protein
VPYGGGMTSHADWQVKTPQPASSHARQWLAAVLLAAVFGIILLITMWPVPVDRGYSGSIDKVLAVLHRNGVPNWFGYNRLEFTANIIMFIPLGFLVALLLSQRLWWLALIICPAFSVSIELTQAVFLAARFATVSDVISNSIGAFVGIFFALLIRAAVYQRDQKVIARALWQREDAR